MADSAPNSYINKFKITTKLKIVDRVKKVDNEWSTFAPSKKSTNHPD